MNSLASAPSTASALDAPLGRRRRFPVGAVLADRLDDASVVDVAVRLAVAHRGPLLLIALMPPLPPRGVALRPERAAVRAVLGRALPRVLRAGISYDAAVWHRPAERDGRLGAARALLDLAMAQNCASLVISRTGPAGLDACTVMEAAALRGGPVVRAASPVPWAPLTAPCPPVHRA
ncbi:MULTISPECIES: universal stress protein [unclassified Streptomyces]|uniref:universal stress protein n=1 Tax=unclassified Streptomyces TaxID=2593676 RepID=UPI0036B4DBE1